MAFFLNLRAKLGLDGSAFTKGLGLAEGQARKFTSNVAGIFAGAFATSALIAQTRAVINYGSRISDLATRLDASAEELQNLDFAATKAGSSLEEVVAGLLGIQRVRRDILKGGQTGKELGEDLAAFGVALDDFRTKGDIEILRQIARAYKAISDAGGDTAILQASLQRIMGGPAGNLATLFTEGLDDHMRLAEQLGIALDTAVISQLDTIADQIAAIAAQLRGPFAEAALIAAEAVLALVRTFKFLGGGIKGFWSGFKEGWGGAQGIAAGIRGDVLSQNPLMPPGLGQALGFLDRTRVGFQEGLKGAGTGFGAELDDLYRQIRQKMEDAEAEGNGLRPDRVPFDERLQAALERIRTRGEVQDRQKLVDRITAAQFKLLTPEKQLLDLTEKRLMLLRQIDLAQEGSLAKLEMEARAAEGLVAIKALEKTIEKDRTGTIRSDALGDIGGTLSVARGPTRSETAVERTAQDMRQLLELAQGLGIKIDAGNLR